MKVYIDKVNLKTVRRAAPNNQEFMWSARPSMNSRLDEPHKWIFGYRN